MRIKFTSLHSSLFLAGINLGDKIDVEKRSGVQMIYNRQDKELLVFMSNQVAILPSTSVAAMIPFEIKDATNEAELPKVEVKKQEPMGSKPIKAQISTPQDHVFKSEAGKTGKDNK